MNKEYQNITQLEVHILNAILNKCETGSQIRDFVRNLLFNKGLTKTFENISFSKSINNLVENKLLIKLIPDRLIFPQGFFYNLNPNIENKIKEFVKLFYELQEIE